MTELQFNNSSSKEKQNYPSILGFKKLQDLKSPVGANIYSYNKTTKVKTFVHWFD